LPKCYGKIITGPHLADAGRESNQPREGKSTMAGTITPWTEERVELLRHHWSAGDSASHIANALGGVTRNAVIGKVHRLGLPGRATVSRLPANPWGRKCLPPSEQTLARRRKIAEQQEKARRAQQIADAVMAHMTKGVDIMELRPSSCRFPIGDPRESGFVYCGCKKHSGPYCDYHTRIAYKVS
jgi:GcrA cell cycle regulator